MSDCNGCPFASVLGYGICNSCYMMRYIASKSSVRRSNRLATKAAVNYYEAPIKSEASIRMHDRVVAERATARAEQQMVNRALRVQACCEVAVARHGAAMKRRTECIIARMEQDAAILASMPATPPRLQRQNAVTDLPPPPPLRRTCQLPDCNELCSYCRENDRIAAYNRAHPLTGPNTVPQLLPPPIGATVVRIPVDLRLMTAVALRELITAAANALGADVEGLDSI